MANLLKKKFLGNDQVDGSKILVENNQAIRFKKADGTVKDVLKVNASDVVEFLEAPVVGGSALQTEAQVDVKVGAESAARITDIQTVTDAIAQEVLDRGTSETAINTSIGTKADRNLGNLTGPTAVNQPLTPDIAATRRLGDINKSWGAVYSARYTGTGATLDVGLATGTSGSNQVTIANAANVIGGGILNLYVPSTGLKLVINGVAGNVLTLAANLAADLSGVQAYALPNVSVRTENEVGATPSGDTLLRSGTTVSGKSGNIQLATGASSSGGVTGDVNILAGATSGTRGKVSLDGSEVTVNNKKITNVANAVSPADALPFGQAQSLIDAAKVIIDAEIALKIDLTEKGAANGVATLDASGLVPTTQLPSYVDDVLEFADLASFPATGEQGKIYVALDTNKTYRWSGSAYVYITSGAVDSVNGYTGVVVVKGSDIVSEMTSHPAYTVKQAIDDLDSRIIATAGAALVWAPEGKVVVDATVRANGYIDLPHLIAPNSLAMKVDRLHLYEGALEDFTVSTVGGVSRVTFLNDIAVGGQEALEDGDNLYYKYQH